MSVGGVLQIGRTRLNHEMEQTAGRAAFPLPMTSTFTLQRHAPSPAVADLVSRRQMSVARALTLLIASASICAAAQPQAFIRVAIHPEPHSCVLAIVAIDGKPLPAAMKQASLSPGRHHLSLRVWLGDAQDKVVHADAPLEQSFKPHHYWIDGEMSKSGLFKLVVEDEDERPPNIKHHPKTK